MICKNCGKVISDAALSCPFCANASSQGAGIQVSMDVLELDELKDMLAVENKPVDINEAEAEVRASLKKKKTIIISLVSVVACFSVVMIALQFRGDTYDNLIEKADTLYQEGDYVAAYELYEKAIDKKEERPEALIGAAKALKETGDYDKSETYIFKALDMDPENEVAYDVLVETITQIQETVEDPEVVNDRIALAEQYAVTDRQKDTLNGSVNVNKVTIDPPMFSELGGKYNDDLNISLSNKDNYQMYYTIDGSDPTTGQGVLYENPIMIKEGTTILKAACFHEGQFGLVKEESYEIAYETPGFPTVSPSSGSFTEQTFITITSYAEGASIYYTWDETTPTTASERYNGPIVVIPGNNVLSIIVVDKHGMTSEVLKCSYTYLPDETLPEEETPEETITEKEPQEDFIVDETVEVEDLPHQSQVSPEASQDNTNTQDSDVHNEGQDDVNSGAKTENSGIITDYVSN